MIIFFVLSHAGVKNIVCYPEDFVTHMYLEFCYLQVPLHCKPIGGANRDFKIRDATTVRRDRK